MPYQRANRDIYNGMCSQPFPLWLNHVCGQTPSWRLAGCSDQPALPMDAAFSQPGPRGLRPLRPKGSKMLQRGSYLIKTYTSIMEPTCYPPPSATPGLTTVCAVPLAPHTMLRHSLQCFHGLVLLALLCHMRCTPLHRILLHTAAVPLLQRLGLPCSQLPGLHALLCYLYPLGTPYGQHHR